MRLVFVSSTFKDMQFERDELNIRLAPRINDYLSKYGESVRFSDLRWGVNTSELESEESSKKVLKVCLDEIDNAKPYMIVFIGERYGWIPTSSLLNESMKMKDIKDVPDNISVTNLEIEYGALLNPDYKGHILFYFRNPFDMSKMSEEERKGYESESPLHKQKLEDLKQKILKLYPEYVRYYDVEYDEENKCLTKLDTLMNTVYDDLTRIFDIDLEYYNSLPRYQRAIMNSETHFESFYKYAYYRDNLVDKYIPNSELKENYEEGRYEDIPCLRYVVGPAGSGKKTTIACLYRLAKEENEDYVLPFVFGLDEFTSNKQALLETLIAFYEEKLGYSLYKSKTILTLVNLIRYNDTHSRHHFQIFIMNFHSDIIIFLKELEYHIKEMFYTTFYIMGSEDKNYSPYLDFAFHSDSLYLEELNEEEKVGIISKICESKRKELSNVVINRIIEKESSGNPLYLSLVVERLLMLDGEDFQNIRNMGDGMEAINNYMLSIVDNAGNDIYSISKELFKELAERINFEVVSKILYLSTHECPVHLNEMHDFFKLCNVSYNELDCSLLYNTIPLLFTPISIYNAIKCDFKEGEKAARDFSEENVDPDFYKYYIAMLKGDDYLTYIRKLSTYCLLNNYEEFYKVYVEMFKHLDIQNNGVLLNKTTLYYLDTIKYLMDIYENDFADNFTTYVIKKFIEQNDPNEGLVLSVLFYPYISRVSSINDRVRFAKLMMNLSRYLIGEYSLKNAKNHAKLDFISSIITSLNFSLIRGNYSFDLEFEEYQEHFKLANKLYNLYDQNIFTDMAKKTSLLSAYYILFDRRARLTYALENYNYKDKYEANKDYYQHFVIDNLEIEKLNEALSSADIDSWINNSLVDSFTALFYDLLITKYESDEEDYLERLNNYLQAATMALQDEFFDLSRITFFEKYFIAPLFNSFAMLLMDESVENKTRYNLFYWVNGEIRELCASDPTNIEYISVYAHILDEYNADELENEDFFFLYPLLYKTIQNHFDRDLLFIALNLLKRATVLYKEEADVEFLYLIEFLFNDNPDDMNIITYQLAAFVYSKGRDPFEDSLIQDAYMYLYDDYELEDQERYQAWLSSYAQWIKIKEK